jgi:hypothetical protein
MNRGIQSLGDVSNEGFSPGKLEQTRSWLVWFLRGGEGCSVVCISAFRIQGAGIIDSLL